MLDPTTLFTYDKNIDSRSLSGSTMLVTLGAFTDAGHAQAVVDEHLLSVLPHRTIGRLDLDQIHDYGAHRPEITLEQDHFADYEAPEIVLHELTAPDDQRFYLLSGPEPTMQWERVAASLRIVHEQLGIRRTVMLQGFPAPVPHTRPIAVTLFADDPAHIVAPRPLPASFRMRSTFTALLTVRLGEAGRLVAHVPQYLHESVYPDAGIALLRAVEDETDLPLPIGALSAAAREAREAIEEQTAQASQLQQILGSLEANYDRALGAEDAEEDASGPRPGMAVTPGQALPSDEELAAELERFLQSLGDEGDDSGEGPAPQI